MRMFFFLLMCAVLVCFGQADVAAEDKAKLQSIDFAVLADGAERVSFVLEQGTTPKIFMLSGEKPRLVIDFPLTGYQGGAKAAADGGVLVKGIRIGFHNEPHMKTRVVIDLSTGGKVDWVKEETGDGLAIVLRAGKPSTPARTEKVVKAVRPVSVEVEKTVEVAAPLTEVAKPAASKKPASVAEPKKGVESAPAVAQPVAQQSTPVAKPAEEKKAVERASDEGSKTVQADPGVPSLLDVSFNVDAEKGEMILFKLDDFHPPVVSAIEKGTPRIICDFYNMQMAGGIKASMDVKGKYVERIRVARHENPGKVRAVLELAPGNDYDLQQVFFNEDNLFVLIVNILGEGESSAQVQ